MKHEYDGVSEFEGDDNHLIVLCTLDETQDYDRELKINYNLKTGKINKITLYKDKAWRENFTTGSSIATKLARLWQKGQAVTVNEFLSCGKVDRQLDAQGAAYFYGPNTREVELKTTDGGKNEKTWVILYDVNTARITEIIMNDEQGLRNNNF